MATISFWVFLMLGLLLFGLALNDVIEQREDSYTVISCTVAFFMLLAALHFLDRM